MNYKTFFLVLVAILLFVSTNSYSQTTYYGASSFTNPGLNNKGDLSFKTAYNFNNNGLDHSTSISVLNNLGVTFKTESFSVMTSETETSLRERTVYDDSNPANLFSHLLFGTKLDESESYTEIYEHHSNHDYLTKYQLYTIGAGFYKRIADDVLLETYGTYGIGKYNISYNGNDRFNKLQAGLHKIELSNSLTVQTKWVDVGLNASIGRASLKNTKMRKRPSFGDENVTKHHQALYLNSLNMGIFVRANYKCVSLEYQFGVFKSNMNPEDITLHNSLGLGINLVEVFNHFK